MAGPSWLVDGKRFATKIKSASGSCDLGEVKWKSHPTRSCPRCQHTIDNNDVAQVWPGLPRGVKFDPTDPELIRHLLAKSGDEVEKSHPFINEFIPTVDEDDGICYTHPKNLPGVKQDGSASHFFHRAIKAYNTGTRKRRKINGDDVGDVRWHKTGRTKPILWNGVQKGCKKIMVLYVSSGKGGKAEKTNWVMHQYHLGTEEDEKDGEYVISKVFQQQQQVKPGDKIGGDIPDLAQDINVKVDPVTPKSVTPEPPRNERRLEPRKESTPSVINSDTVVDSDTEDHSIELDDEVMQPEVDNSIAEVNNICDKQIVDNDENHSGEDNKWWDSESQYLISSQQLVEGLSLCDDLFQSQPEDGIKKRSVLSEYARLGPAELKTDLEECQNLDLDPANIDLDTPPDFRLSQLDFGSEESYLAWGEGKALE